MRPGNEPKFNYKGKLEVVPLGRFWTGIGINQVIAADTLRHHIG